MKERQVWRVGDRVNKTNRGQKFEPEHPLQACHDRTSDKSPSEGSGHFLSLSFCGLKNDCRKFLFPSLGFLHQLQNQPFPHKVDGSNTTENRDNDHPYKV